MSLTRRSLAVLPLAGLLPTHRVAASQAVNVYTTREPGLLQPVLQRFTAETGVAVNTVFLRQGVAERVEAEGAVSPADLVILADIGELADFTRRGLAQPMAQPATGVLPAGLRDAGDRWVALTMRARAILVSRERVRDQALTYEGLADPRWRGKLCIRSGQHPYNVALIAAHLEHHGEAKAVEWLTGMKSNLARKPAGGDREVARDIMGGLGDIGLSNTYYVGLMLSGRGGEQQQAWGQAVRVVLPSFTDGAGAHVNVSGAAIARHAPNAARARQLLAWLLQPEAQRQLAEANFEYPVRPGVEPHPLIAALGPLRLDQIALQKIAERRAEASLLVDRVALDR
jgi:iron(III) transport system substrate-binding protein